MAGRRAFIGRLFPWNYTRQPLPSPGSEQLAFRNLALPLYTPSGPSIQNSRQIWFQTGNSIQPHLIGVQGIGGLISGTAGTTPLTPVQQGLQAVAQAPATTVQFMG